LHAFGAAATLPVGAQLAIAARGAAAVWASAVFVVTAFAVYAVSASYHLLARTKRAQAVMQRMDHAAIFFLIAGSATPLCVLALSPWAATALLVMIWGGAAVGATLKARGRADRAAKALYLIVGWSVIAVLPAVWNETGIAAGLIVGGGLIYTAGAVAFSKQWPRARCAVFGYHEVWHSATLIAGALHFAAVTKLVS
jgi:hemolysin III